jgi:hypothetical protein
MNHVVREPRSALLTQPGYLAGQRLVARNLPPTIPFGPTPQDQMQFTRRFATLSYLDSVTVPLRMTEKPACSPATWTLDLPLTAL